MANLYVESFEQLRTELLRGLPQIRSMIGKTVARMKRAGSLRHDGDDRDAAESLRHRRWLIGMAKRLGVTIAEVVKSPNLAAASECEERAAHYVIPFAAKACRLALAAFDEEMITSPVSLWSELRTQRPGAGEQAAAGFFLRVIVPALNVGASHNRATKPWAIVDTVAATIAALSDSVVPAEWSEVMQIKQIAARLGCEAKARTVRNKLKSVHSELQQNGLQHCRVRLDTMDEDFRGRFKK